MLGAIAGDIIGSAHEFGVTKSVDFPLFSSKRHFLCDSIGYGFPYATQYSNGLKPVNIENISHYETVVIQQAEPNGLFMPSAADGTWVMCSTKEGPKPVYIEPHVIVSPFKLED